MLFCSIPLYRCDCLINRNNLRMNNNDLLAGQEATVAGDWRSELQVGRRSTIIDKIMETLRRHIPVSGQEGIQELKKIAVRFEEKIFNAATSQSDYLQKLSLKMLAMDTKSQNPMSGSNSAALLGMASDEEWLEVVYQEIKNMRMTYLSDIREKYIKIAGKVAAPQVGEPDLTMDVEGWRSQLSSDSRQRIIDKIMQTLRRHLPVSGPEGVQELQKIAARFEEKIYSASSSQSDYLRKISMKMLGMETKSQNLMASQASNAGLNQGVTGLPTLKDWPLTAIDQLIPNLGLQVQRPNLPNQNQFYMASDQQQVLAQAQAQCLLPTANFNGKDGQSQRNDRSICCPAQSNSPRMKMSQMQQSSSQQKDRSQQQQPQLQRNNMKRKQHCSSSPAKNTCTGNTLGPSLNSPPSTHTLGDAMTGASSMQHVNSVSKSRMMHGTEGGGIASSTNQRDDLENLEDISSIEENVESFLSNDGDGNLCGTLKQTLIEHKTESSKSFTFGEAGCLRTRNKMICCHFSSDGKLLASAGYDRKVVLWNMDTLQYETTSEEHQSFITDVRFRPNSTLLATASFDKSVRLWDASNPSYCLNAYTGHSSHVMSLDFHPQKTDLFCFCDSNSQMHYWNTSTFSCTRVSKQGGHAQVRFQPINGHVLAAASDKVVSIFDVESDRQIHSFQGTGMVSYLCWDFNGEILASVSEEAVKVWSLASGQCIHYFPAIGNQFHSCVFHPSYSALLVIGGTQSLELWNMIENKSMTVPAHENIVSALAQSPVTGMVASTSHDSTVKLWNKHRLETATKMHLPSGEAGNDELAKLALRIEENFFASATNQSDYLQKIGNAWYGERIQPYAVQRWKQRRP